MGLLRSFASQVVAIPEILIEFSSQLSGSRSKSRPSTFEKEDGNQAALRRFGVRNEPAETRAFVRAGSRFAKDREFLEAGPQPTGGSILHRARHSILHFWNVPRDIQSPLHLWRKRGQFFRSFRMLEVIEGSSVGHGRHECAQ